MSLLLALVLAAGAVELENRGKANCGAFPNTAKSFDANTLYVSNQVVGFDAAPLVKRLEAVLKCKGWPLKVKLAPSSKVFDLPKDAATSILVRVKNSFVVNLHEELTAGMARTEVCTVCPPGQRAKAKEAYGAMCPAEGWVFGHNYDQCYDFMALNYTKTYHENLAPARRYTYMATLIAHELAHASHQRVLAGLLQCKENLTLEQAQGATIALRKKLGISNAGMHHPRGLLAPGGVQGSNVNIDVSVSPNPNDPNEKSLYNCLAKAPEKALDDPDFCRAETPCVGGLTLADFYELPAASESAIKAQLSRSTCDDSCWYGLPGF